MRIHTFFYIATLACIANSAAFACGDVRLDDPGGSMANQPIYDQGKSNLCFSFSAIQMYDGLRASSWFGVADTRRSSPLATAIQATDLGNPFAQRAGLAFGGYPEDAIKLMLSNGSCAREDFLRISDPTNGEIEQMLLEIYNSNHQNPDTHRNAIKMACTLAPQIGISDAATYLDSFSQELSAINYLEFLRQLKDDACSKSRAITLPASPKVEMALLSTEGVPLKGRGAWLDQQLSQNFVDKTAPPIEISFCQSILRSKTAPNGLNEYDNSSIYRDHTSLCGIHAAVIVGTRQTPKGCEVLLRNSWGESCESIAWPCDRKAGQYWLPIDKLGPQTQQIITFKKD